MFIESKEKIYTDIPLSFTAHPVTGNVKTLTNADSIIQSVKNIVLTNFFERPYAPYLGGNIYNRLFDNVESTYTQFLIAEDITTSLENYEPRADILNVSVFPDTDRNTLKVKVKFIPVTSAEPVTVDVIVERVR